MAENNPFGLRPVRSMRGGNWTDNVTEYYISSTTSGGITTGYGTSIFTGDPVVFNTTDDAPANGQNGYLATAGTIARYNPGFTDAAPSTFGTTPILGVFMGCEYYDSNVNSVNNPVRSKYWPASTTIVPGTQIKAMVLDDPYIIYEIQMSTHVNADAGTFTFDGHAPVLPVNNPAGANAAANLAGSFGSNFALNIGGGTNFTTIRLDPASATTAGIYNNNPTSGSTATGQSAFYMDVTTQTGGDETHDYDKTVATLPLKLISYSLDTTNIARPNPIGFALNPKTYTMQNTPFLKVYVMINNHAYKIGTLGVDFA